MNEKYVLTSYGKKLVGSNSLEQVKRIYDSMYSNLLRFFSEILFGVEKNTCTVLVARRCLIIAQWFFEYVSEIVNEVADDIDIRKTDETIVIKVNGKSNYIISDNAINPRLLKKVEHINIVDDILIHGRQIHRVKKEIDSILKFTNIKIKPSISMKVFMCCHPNMYENENNLDCVYDSFNSSWIGLSQRLVKMITSLNIPYVSYLNSYTQENVSNEVNNNFIENVRSQNKFSLLNLESGERKSFFIYEHIEDKIISMRLKAKCNVERLDKKFILEDEVATAFVRYYYNEDHKTASFIPYVVLKNIPYLSDDDLREDKIKDLFGNYLCENSCVNINNVIIDMFNIEKNKNVGSIEYINKFIYNILSAVASFSYGLSVRNELKILSFFDRLCSDYSNILTLTFGESIRQIVLDENNYVCKLSKEEKIDTNGVEIFNKKIIKKAMPFEPKIKNYLKKLWCDDEVNAVYGFDKKKADTLVNIIGKCSDPYKAMATIIRACDNGEAHISGKFRNNRIESVLSVGELGYRFVMDDYFMKEQIRDLSQNLKYLLD